MLYNNNKIFKGDKKMIWNLLAEGDQQPKGNNAVTYIMLAVFAVLLIGMFVWQSISNKKKQKKAQETVDALKVGDRVKTIGGVCGFIYEINNAENTFVLETGTADKKSYVKFDKGAIYQTAPANGKDEVREVEEPAEEKTDEKVEEKTEETK